MATYTIKKLIESLDSWDPDCEIIFEIQTVQHFCGSGEYCYCDPEPQEMEILKIEDEVILEKKYKEKLTGRVKIFLD